MRKTPYVDLWPPHVPPHTCAYTCTCTQRGRHWWDIHLKIHTFFIRTANLTAGGHRQNALGGAGLVGRMDAGLGDTPTVFVSGQTCTQCIGQGARIGKTHLLTSIFKV